MLHFYHHPMSPYSQKVFFLLEEAGKAYDLQMIALEKRDHRKPPYLSVNPAGRVPSIKDGDFIIHESNAIMRYIVRRFDLHAYYPCSLRDQAEVDMWWEFCSHHINKPLMDIVWHRVMAAQYGWRADPFIIHRAETSLEKDLPVLERHLEGRHFMVGGELSLADINLMPFVHHGLALLGDEKFPAVARWRDLVSTRQAWRNVAAYSG
jgi:glutathione S-transferase